MTTNNKIGHFLNRDHTFSQVEVVYETARKRTIKFLDGPQKGKTKNIHPEGVSWGNLYPRLFATKPDDVFVFKGRTLPIYKNTENNPLVPKIEPYNFPISTGQIIDSINASDKVLITGDAGVGKTSLFMQLAARIGQPVIRINLNIETRISDFLGKMTIVSDGKNSTTSWQDGILPTAMKKGMWLIVDELSFGDAGMLGILHPILEPNGKLILKENGGEVVEPHPNFRILATDNAIGVQQTKADMYAGTSDMNTALLDRFHIFALKNPDEKEQAKIIKMRVPALKKKFARNMVKFAGDVRKAISGEAEGANLSLKSLSLRQMIKWAQKTALYRNPHRGAENVFLNSVTSTDREVLVRLISVHFGGPKLKKNDKETKPVSDSDKPMNDAEKKLWKSFSKGKGRVSREEMNKRISALKDFRSKNNK